MLVLLLILTLLPINLPFLLQTWAIIVLVSAIASDTVILFSTSIFDYNYALFTDSLSTILGLLTLVIMLCCVCYQNFEDLSFSFFLFCITSLGILLNEAFVTKDLLVFFICFEGVIIPMFLIIKYWGSTRIENGKANLLFIFYTLIGSLGFLFVILLVYSFFETTYVFALENIPFNLQFIVWPLLFIGFAVKLPLFPFHSWLPQAHVEAPTVGSVILASLLLKLGGYGILRFILPFFNSEVLALYTPFVYVMLFCGTLLAALVALLQTDIKRIIAYSSIAHMSVCSFGFFTKSLTALLSAYLILIAHGFVSGALFFLIGCLYDRIHARLLRNISGLASLMPLFSIYFVLFSLANIGFPLSFNFCVEFGLFLGLFQNNFLVGLFGSLGIILSGFFSMWLVNRLLFGGLKITYSYAFIDLYLTEHLVLIILFVPTLYFGINFSKISVLVEQALLTYLFT